MVLLTEQQVDVLNNKTVITDPHCPLRQCAVLLATTVSTVVVATVGEVGKRSGQSSAQQRLLESGISAALQYTSSTIMSASSRCLSLIHI